MDDDWSDGYPPGTLGYETRRISHEIEGMGPKADLIRQGLNHIKETNQFALERALLKDDI